MEAWTLFEGILLRWVLNGNRRDTNHFWGVPYFETRTQVWSTCVAFETASEMFDSAAFLFIPELSASSLGAGHVQNRCPELGRAGWLRLGKAAPVSVGPGGGEGSLCRERLRLAIRLS